MYTRSFSLRATAAAGLLTLLAACGGGGNVTTAGVAPPAGGGGGTVTPGPTSQQQATFVTDYSNGVAALKTYGGLTSTSFPDLFDDAFLDAGYTKAQLRSNLAQEATAMTIAPDLSSFPGVKLSSLTISACDANNICTLTGTVTNSDVDTTASTFTTKVRLQDGKVRVYGDQAAATT